MTVWCLCSCHAPSDEEREEGSTFSGVPMLDPAAVHTARACCSNVHWRALYFATEPERAEAKEKTPWVDGATSSQADGWKGD